jgi:two-component system, cell cycle response regulator DivK
MPEGEMSRKPLVLIVDDSRDNREGYAEYLRFHGFRTREASCGEEALAIARRLHPDVVLLDLRLPDFDGTEVTRRLRASWRRQTPIIALSACVMGSDIESALASGCSAFLGKPCLPDNVLAEIRRQLEATQAA